MLHSTQHFSHFCLRNLELQHIFSLADGKFSAWAGYFRPASANFSYPNVPWPRFYLCG